jgi:hypothetical protein
MGLHEAWCSTTMLNEYIKHFRGGLANLFVLLRKMFCMRDWNCKFYKFQLIRIWGISLLQKCFLTYKRMIQTSNPVYLNRIRFSDKVMFHLCLCLSGEGISRSLDHVRSVNELSDLQWVLPRKCWPIPVKKLLIALKCVVPLIVPIFRLLSI